MRPNSKTPFSLNPTTCCAPSPNSKLIDGTHNLNPEGRSLITTALFLIACYDI
jgi:hypothetical protein